MAKRPNTKDKSQKLAAGEDVIRVLGKLDEATVTEILALRPIISDIEQAALWLGGDSDIFGAGKPVKGVVGDIVAIVTQDEDEEALRRQ